MFGRKKNKIHAYFITNTGKIVDDDFNVDNSTIDHKEHKYIVNKEARLLNESRQISYIYVEGVPVPLDFNEINPANLKLKIDSVTFKSILKTKLFRDLFNPDPGEMIKEMVFDILLIVNLILTIIIMLKVTGVLDRITNAG